MQSNQSRNFLATIIPDGQEGEDGRARFFNLDAVRMVDQIREGHVRLWFSEAHTVEFNGDGAGSVVARICDRSITGDGAPVELEKLFAAAIPTDGSQPTK
jgi:hypothetical protein